MCREFNSPPNHFPSKALEQSRAFRVSCLTPLFQRHCTSVFGRTRGRYLEWIDWTGRQVRPGKRGSIASSALPILDRLGISTPDWLSLAAGFGQLFARVAGRSGAAAEWSRTRGRRFHPGQSRLLGAAKS